MRNLIGLAGFVLVVATTGAACAPAALSPDQIVAAFIAASQDGSRTMHMEWQGTIHTSQQTDEPGLTSATINATFEFGGADYEGVLTTSSSGEFGDAGSTVSFAQVGGVSFTRYDGGDWQRIDGSAGTPLSYDPLAGLMAGDVAYEVPDTLDLVQVHRLRVADPISVLRQTLLPAAFGEISPGAGRASDFRIYVDAQGIPVAAHLDIDVQVKMNDPNSTAPEIQYGFTSEYEFSDWGAPITIIAPPVTGGGFDDKPPPPIDFPPPPKNLP